jgi:hypothetical protein
MMMMMMMMMIPGKSLSNAELSLVSVCKGKQILLESTGHIYHLYLGGTHGTFFCVLQEMFSVKIQKSRKYFP